VQPPDENIRIVDTTYFAQRREAAKEQASEEQIYLAIVLEVLVFAGALLM